MIKSFAILFGGCVVLSLTAQADGLKTPFRCYQQPQDKYCVEGMVKDGTDAIMLVNAYLPVREETYPPSDDPDFYISGNMSFGTVSGDNQIYIKDDNSGDLFPIATTTSERNLTESSPSGWKMFSQAISLLDGVEMSSRVADHMAAPICDQTDTGLGAPVWYVDTIESTITTVTFTSLGNSGSISGEYNFRSAYKRPAQPSECPKSPSP